MGKHAKQQSAEQMREYRLRREQEEREKQRKQNRIILWTLVGIAAVALIGVIIGIVVTQLGKESDPFSETIVPEVDQMDPSQFTETDQTTEYVKLTVTYTDENGDAQQGDIIVRLRTDIAPITVKNFQKLVGEHFYDGLTFHRVYSGFMIQGGDPDGDGSGGSDETIKGEFLSMASQTTSRTCAAYFPWPAEETIPIQPPPSFLSCMRTAIFWTATTQPLAMWSAACPP